MNRSLAVVFALALLVGAGGCGSGTPKSSDGGGTGGSHADASDGLDARREDARRDSAPRKDAATTEDARTTDAHADARRGDARHDAPTSPADASPGDARAGGACTQDSDCMLYSPEIGTCCGDCLPKADPVPGTVNCLVACTAPIRSCTCVKRQCTGSTTPP